MLSVYAIDISQEIRREISDAKLIQREISHRRPRPSFILFIYLLLTISIMWISFRVQSRFAQLTCIGIAMTVFFYMFVNVAMVTGLLPVVGAPLPFISYGGTSMLTLFIAFGIVASAIVHDRRET